VVVCAGVVGGVCCCRACGSEREGAAVGVRRAPSARSARFWAAFRACARAGECRGVVPVGCLPRCLCSFVRPRGGPASLPRVCVWCRRLLLFARPPLLWLFCWAAACRACQLRLCARLVLELSASPGSGRVLSCLRQACFSFAVVACASVCALARRVRVRRWPPRPARAVLCAALVLPGSRSFCRRCAARLLAVLRALVLVCRSVAVRPPCLRFPAGGGVV
jgi:hypothetical protein